MNVSLTYRQQQTIATALTLLAAGVIVAVALYVVSLVVQFVGFFSGVFLPLAVAGILATLLKPYYRWCTIRRGWPPVLSVVVVFVSFLLPLIFFVWVFVAMLFSQLPELSQHISGVMDRFLVYVQESLPALQMHWEAYGVADRLRVLLQERGDLLMNGLQQVGASALSAGSSAFALLAGAAGWLVVPVYIVFFLLAKPYSRKQVAGAFPFLKAETRRDVIYLGEQFVEILVSFFRGQILIALAQGALFAVGFGLIGLKFGFLIGFMLGLLNIVPYLGSIIGLGVALPLAYFQEGGGGVLLALVFLVFVVVQSIEGYVLTPRIMGDRTGLHPLTIMVAMLFWGVALDGVIGMILAIPLTAFLVVFWRLAKMKYIREIV